MKISDKPTKEPEFRHPQGFPGDPPKVRRAGQPLPNKRVGEGTAADSQPTEEAPDEASQ